MGDMQCAVSGLPIFDYGGKVYWFILSQNLAASEGGGAWVPRTWPIACTLGDYGSPSHVPEGPLRDVILQALDVDVVEMGPGSYVMDGPVQKGMEFATMLEHLRQERLFVWDGEHRERFERDGEPAYAPREPKRLALRSAFIKAEVWEALVRARVEGIAPIAAYEEDIQFAMNAWPWMWQENQKRFSRLPWLAKLEWGQLALEHPRARHLLPSLAAMVGDTLLPVHALLLYERGGWGGAFASLAAEFSRICDILRATRRAWAPSAMVGDLGALRDLRPFSQVARVIEVLAAQQLKARGDELRAEGRRHRAYLAKRKKT